MKGRILTVAGSDSGGGAGIQADIKTITALGGFATSSITAVTVQNTMGVHDVYDLPASLVAAQIEAVLTDIGADAIKVGMVDNSEIIKAVAVSLDEHSGDAPIIVDPIVAATDGTMLLKKDAIDALKTNLFLIADLITPNVTEAQALTGLEIETVDDMKRAAEILITLGCPGVLLTGSHLYTDDVTDVLVTEDSIETMSGPRINAPNNHGTGCTVSAAIATGLAQGMSMSDAVHFGRDYVKKAIETAPNLGKGNGPLNHMFAQYS